MSPGKDIDAAAGRRAAVPPGLRLAAALLAAAPAGGCGTYRIEYRPPGFEAAAGMQQDPVTLDDGTVLIYRPRQTEGDLRAAGEAGGVQFEIREEKEDGTIVLRAILPEHVLANTLTCLRNEEYELLWDQMIAAQTRRAYELRGQGYEEYKRFFSANRNELAATVMRMSLGLTRQESYMESAGGGVIRFRLYPRIAAAFKFKTVDVVAEGDGLKLLMIR